MAQRILGLDIGARSIKAVLLEVGLRRYQAVALEEVPLPPPDSTPPAGGPDGERDGNDPEQPPDEPQTPGSAAWLARLGEALATLRDRLGSRSHEACITAVPAELVTVRPISLPFTRAREIDAVLGQEVEEYIPFRGLDEVVFDHLTLAQVDGVSQLLVAVCPRGPLEGLLATLQGHGFDPRLMTAGGLSKAHLARALQVDETGPVAVVDIGHAGTTITIVARGKVLLWRTLMRGGRQLAQAIARAYGITETQAEAPLASEVEILPPDTGAEYHPERVRLSELAKKSLQPIARGVKQALLSFSGIHDQDVRAVYLCGGLSRLPGLEQFFASQIGLPLRELEAGRQEWALPLGPAAEGLGWRAAEALSLALAGLPQTRQEEVNFRKGPLAFQGGYQYARGKVLGIAAVFALLLLGVGFYTFAVGHDLAKQERALIADLKARTQVLLGEPLADPEQVLARMRRSEKGAKTDEIPQQSAYDLLHDISRVLPLEVQVDFETLDIDLDRHRTEIRGKTTTATAVEQIVDALNQIPCFQGGIEKEKNEKVGSEGKQLFVLNVKMSC